jgi:hypothetical protein
MSDLERRVLAFESLVPSRPFSAWKQRAIRADFDFSSSIYSLHLFRALDHPDAVRYAPEVVERWADVVAERRRFVERLQRRCVTPATPIAQVPA